MAKGIITTKPSGSTPNGRIIVSDGTTVDPNGRTAAALQIGSTVDYTDTVSVGLGDLVEFLVDEKGIAYGIKTLSAGTVLTGTISDNVTVNAGESVLISATVEGKVVVNGGFVTILDGSRIGGKIESKVIDSYVFSNKVLVEGKVELNGASYLSLQNTTVEGKVSTDGTVFTSVSGCTISGSLEVLNAKTCQCSSNTVSGKITTPGCTA